MSKKKPKTIDASCPVSFMGCEGKVILEMTPTEAVLMIEKVWQENKRLRQENATLTAEHDALREERDDIRRSYCSLMEAYRGGDGRVTANKLGWDCFKENT